MQLVLTRTDLLSLNTSASTLQSSDNHLQLRPDDLEQELFESYTISFPNCSSLWWSPPFHFNVSRSLFHLQSSLLIGFDAAVVVGMTKAQEVSTFATLVGQAPGRWLELTCFCV